MYKHRLLMCVVGFGQDSHRFLTRVGSKKCVVGGVLFPDIPGMDADSDGDVVFHAICNAISSITHEYILGGVAPKLCHEEGVIDSREYVLYGAKSLISHGYRVSHLSVSIEGERPKLQHHLQVMRGNVSEILGVSVSQVGMTCTSGNRLTECGNGGGLSCCCILTALRFDVGVC